MLQLPSQGDSSLVRLTAPMSGIVFQYFHSIGPSQGHTSLVSTKRKVTDDEQSSDLYVDNCFPEIYEKFINNKKQISAFKSQHVKFLGISKMS